MILKSYRMRRYYNNVCADIIKNKHDFVRVVDYEIDGENYSRVGIFEEDYMFENITNIVWTVDSRGNIVFEWIINMRYRPFDERKKWLGRGLMSYAGFDSHRGEIITVSISPKLHQWIREISEPLIVMNKLSR